MKTSLKRLLLTICCILLSAAVWLHSVHYFFQPKPDQYFSEDRLSPNAQRLLNYHLRIWKDPVLRREFAVREHKNNPEWDFMWRTFLVLSMTNISLREPERQKELLPAIDAIIGDTLEKINANGMYYFLMSYAKASPWGMSPPASLFHDGEIALMIQCRRLIQRNEKYDALGDKYLDSVVNNMKRCSLSSAESYPNECWLFCNTVALMSLRLADHLDGTDHSGFFRQWMKNARGHLIDSKTGLLHSAYTIDGRTIHGPEGSSIWMAAHCLSFIDPVFARKQFDIARRELFVNVFNFGFSREWPLSWKPQLDCDAGGVFALMQASPSASMFALLAARTFKDRSMADRLVTSLNYGGLPTGGATEMHYNAGNLVADAVILYAMVQGEIQKRVLGNAQ